MKLKIAQIRNFRRLENITLNLEDGETLIVGPNNSGKTSATTVFRCFLGKRNFQIHDFPLRLLKDLDAWYPDKTKPDGTPDKLPECPSSDDLRQVPLPDSTTIRDMLFRHFLLVRSFLQ